MPDFLQIELNFVESFKFCAVGVPTSFVESWIQADLAVQSSAAESRSALLCTLVTFIEALPDLIPYGGK
jgi:hypothetical protein